jgi:hypothetical protein
LSLRLQIGGALSLALGIGAISAIFSLDASKDTPFETRCNHDFTVKARLKPGMPLGTARAELTTIWNNL